MGSNMSRTLRSWLSRNERRCLLVGLDNAGKSTVLYKLGNPTEAVATMPTLGFNVETMRVGKLTLNIWDVGGQDKLRPFWRHYYTGTQGIIFVVDSSDSVRFDLVREELEAVVQDDQLTDAAVLILANKQDLPGALSADELRRALNVDSICDRKAVLVQPTVASTGEGLVEGIRWLCLHMRTL